MSRQTHNSYFHSAFIDFSVSAVGSRVVESRSRNIFTICNRRSSTLPPKGPSNASFSSFTLRHQHTHRESGRDVHRYSYYMYAAEFCLWLQNTTNVLTHKQRTLSRQRGAEKEEKEGRGWGESLLAIKYSENGNVGKRFQFRMIQKNIPQLRFQWQLLLGTPCDKPFVFNGFPQAGGVCECVCVCVCLCLLVCLCVCL